MGRRKLLNFFFQAEDGIRYDLVTWSSDVCSSDLCWERRRQGLLARAPSQGQLPASPKGRTKADQPHKDPGQDSFSPARLGLWRRGFGSFGGEDRKSVV